MLRAGNPKGVVLTHNNVLATVKALQVHLDVAGFALHSDDCVLSYLTLAHIFGRCVEEFVLSLGAQIGYWQARRTRRHLCCFPHEDTIYLCGIKSGFKSACPCASYAGTVMTCGCLAKKGCTGKCEEAR